MKITSTELCANKKICSLIMEKSITLTSKQNKQKVIRHKEKNMLALFFGPYIDFGRVRDRSLIGFNNGTDLKLNRCGDLKLSRCGGDRKPSLGNYVASLDFSLVFADIGIQASDVDLRKLPPRLNVSCFEVVTKSLE